MGPRRTTATGPRGVTALVALTVALGAALAGCGSGTGGAGGDAAPSGSSTAGASEGDRQRVATFVVPFTVAVPDWVDPTPSESTAHFVTWQTADQTRGIRVMSPVEVYRPGSARPGPVPRRFEAYLTSLRASGARISDVARRRVDGRPATVLTVAAPPGNSLDGALGCPETCLEASDCFGPQDELVLRVVHVDVDGHPVLIWEKDQSDDAGSVDYAPFEEMLASLTLS